jgi:hypothetical protein
MNKMRATKKDKKKEVKLSKNEVYKLYVKSTWSESFETTETRELFDTSEYTFKTLEEVKKHLREMYPKIVPAPSFVDTKDGQTIQVGWIFGFNSSDGHKSFWQEDWVDLRIETSKLVLPSKWKPYF